jgi:hypothetical protein
VHWYRTHDRLQCGDAITMTADTLTAYRPTPQPANSALASTKVEGGVRVEAEAVVACWKVIAPVDDSGRRQHLTNDVEVEAMPTGTPSRFSTAPIKTARRMRTSART